MEAIGSAMSDYISRDIETSIRNLALWFPVVSITGPRQSGKSTLSKKLFPNHEYVNLELPGLRQQALDDPIGFIRSHSPNLIIDEAQYVPELFSVIQVESDLRDQTGQYVITGSQSFALRSKITQSLAGRVGQAILLPLAYRETKESAAFEYSIKGGYPRLYTADIPPKAFYSNYVSTYLERDIAGQINASNLATFRNFLRVCADNVGNLLNVSKIASDLSINTRTANSWLSLLESSYLIFRLRPWFSNTRKRLVKTPKLYFYDTGLLCHLLGIKDMRALEGSEYKGRVFENLIVAETAKRHFNSGEQPDLFFYRDHSQNDEIDLIDFSDQAAPELFEIKASQTYKPNFLSAVSSQYSDFKTELSQAGVIMRVDSSSQVNDFKIWKAEDWLSR